MRLEKFEIDLGADEEVRRDFMLNCGEKFLSIGLTVFDPDWEDMIVGLHLKNCPRMGLEVKNLEEWEILDSGKTSKKCIDPMAIKKTSGNEIWTLQRASANWIFTEEVGPGAIIVYSSPLGRFATIKWKTMVGLNRALKRRDHDEDLYDWSPSSRR